MGVTKVYLMHLYSPFFIPFFIFTTSFIHKQMAALEKYVITESKTATEKQGKNK